MSEDEGVGGVLLFDSEEEGGRVLDVFEGEERPLKDDERFNKVDKNPRLGSRCGDFYSMFVSTCSLVDSKDSSRSHLLYFPLQYSRYPVPHHISKTIP